MGLSVKYRKAPLLNSSELKVNFNRSTTAQEASTFPSVSVRAEKSKSVYYMLLLLMYCSSLHYISKKQ